MSSDGTLINPTNLQLLLYSKYFLPRTVLKKKFQKEIALCIFFQLGKNQLFYLVSKAPLHCLNKEIVADKEI